MRVPLNWLREFVTFDIAPEEIASGLTRLGLEVEAIEQTTDDTIFDISITPNRPDCLSISGIARELAIALRKGFREPLINVRSSTPSGFRIIIDNEELCPRYAGRIIRNIKIKDSPDWLKKRLEQCGFRSINNVVDITNYVLLELGHPLHAFDLDTLKGNTIRVALAGKNQKIKTLDSIERKVPDETLLIWDSERPIAIAGIMGALDTEVRPDTKNIFLEGAYFSPLSIRRSSKSLGLKTESSYRFERGTDIEGLIYSVDRAVDLVLDICGGELTDVLDEYPSKFKSSEIILRPQRVKDVIGDEVSHEEIKEILTRLGFPFTFKDGDFIVKTISRRSDVNLEIDLIEEIARVRGYEKIPAKMPVVELSFEINKKLKDIELIKTILRARGFSEAINFSFMDINSLKALEIPEEDERFCLVEIKNPLRKEDSFLRTTLLPSLLENLRTNIRFGIKDLMLFEIARVFLKKDQGLPQERLSLGIIKWHDSRPVLWRDNLNPFYILREVMDGIASEFMVKEVVYRPSEEPFLHKGQSSDLFIRFNGNDIKIGYMGIVSQKVLDRLDIKTSSPVALLEMDLDTFLSARGSSPVYKALPRFPYIERDISVIVDNTIPAEELRKLVITYPSDIIESVSIFDYYRGGNIPPDKKSIGLRILYRSRERTLTEEEVEKVHNEIINSLLQKTGGSIRF